MGKIDALYKREKESKVCESVFQTCKDFVLVAYLEGNSGSKLIQNFKYLLPYISSWIFVFLQLAEKHLP